ncbi:MAG: hypothetical protein AAF723_07960 [Pseudomonadota bacterium]
MLPTYSRPQEQLSTQLESFRRSWLLEPLGLSKTDRVYVLVVRQNGEVLLTLEGTYSEEKATQVRAVFENAVAF